MTNERPYKRRHFFVKKEYQAKFILKFCLIVLAGSVISTGLIYFFSQGSLTSSYENSRLVIKKTAMAILPAIIYTNIITLIMITLATIGAVLFISHKIAGPMFRFEKELKLIGRGDLTKIIRLRKDDQITDMAESLNKMTTRLHDKVFAIRAAVENLIATAEKQNTSPEIVEALKRLHRTIDEEFHL